MKFDDAQQEAITHKDGPMLVLAGPGSGKTATLVARTGYLIKEYGISPSNILVITFTKAAAMEMKQRFLQNYGNGENHAQVTFGTFHAVFFMVLKMAYHFDASNIVKEDARREFLGGLIYKYKLEYREEQELIQGLLSDISRFKNSGKEAEKFESAHCDKELFHKIYREYDEFLKVHRFLDFDDMLGMTYELFCQRPDILQAWQKKYTYILVDEFQDINRIQYEIVKLLGAPGNHLFMVGDDDQSIYRFRGSEPEIMLSVPKDFPDLKQILLNRNYRCQQGIVDASLRVIAHNKERYLKEITATKSWERDVEYLVFPDIKEQNKYIIEDIQKCCKEGIKLCEIAVLFRTNTQPRLLMEQLMSYNLGFKTKEQIPNLFEHWIAKDIRTYLQIAEGSRLRKDFLSILNKPKRYLKRDSLCYQQVDFELWKRRYENQFGATEQIEKLEADLKLLGRMRPYAAVNYIRHGIGYDDYILEHAQNKNINAGELFQVLEELQMSAKAYVNYKEWENHMKEMSRQVKKNRKQTEENAEAITLSTLHGAKGLEYKVVYIIEANEGVMPYKKAVMPEDVEEERRLFYVGMTRAISKLSICSVEFLQGKEAAVSRFVHEAKS